MSSSSKLAYHAGEIAVQRRAGVREVAERSLKGIRDFVPAGAAHFLAEQRMLLIGALGSENSVWASLLHGPQGFIKLADEREVLIQSRPPEDDPLCSALLAGTALGTLAIEVETRRRLRVNGDAVLQPDGVRLHVREMFGNCQQYIQLRQPEESAGEPGSAPKTISAHVLNEAQQKQIRAADTFFIASRHPEAGCDVSHRGGHPGFVVVQGPQELLWPDYSGNNMYQTLGNLAASPACGLLFLDFASGATLQMSGEAEILWEHPRMAEFPGALRLVRFRVEKILEIQRRLPMRWKLRQYSPFNP